MEDNEPEYPSEEYYDRLEKRIVLYTFNTCVIVLILMTILYFANLLPSSIGEDHAWFLMIIPFFCWAEYLLNQSKGPGSVSGIFRPISQIFFNIILWGIFIYFIFK